MSDTYRQDTWNQINKKKYDEQFEKIFGKKRHNTMDNTTVTNPDCPICKGTSYDTRGPIAEECPVCK